MLVAALDGGSTCWQHMLVAAHVGGSINLVLVSLAFDPIQQDILQCLFPLLLGADPICAHREKMSDSAEEEPRKEQVACPTHMPSN